MPASANAILACVMAPLASAKRYQRGSMRNGIYSNTVCPETDLICLCHLRWRHVIPCFTTTDIGKLYFTMMAGLAEYESSQIGRRVKAGMARAKAQGKWISRPPLPEHTQRRIKELRRQNASIRKIAAQVGASKATVQKYLA